MPKDDCASQILIDHIIGENALVWRIKWMTSLPELLDPAPHSGKPRLAEAPVHEGMAPPVITGFSCDARRWSLQRLHRDAAPRID